MDIDNVAFIVLCGLAGGGYQLWAHYAYTLRPPWTYVQGCGIIWLCCVAYLAIGKPTTASQMFWAMTLIGIINGALVCVSYVLDAGKRLVAENRAAQRRMPNDED